jgi:hypothetical protein
MRSLSYQFIPLSSFTFECLIMKVDMYYHSIWTHLNGILQKCVPLVCVPVCVSLVSSLGKGSLKCIPPFCDRQRLCKPVPAATNTRNNRRIVGCVIFSAVRVLLKESMGVCLRVPLSLLSNNSVKKFPQQQTIAGGVVLYAVHVVSKESRRLVLPRTSCYPWFIYRRRQYLRLYYNTSKDRISE